MKKRLKKILVNFVTSGRSNAFPIEIMRRIILVNLICSLGLLLFLLFGLNALFTGYYSIFIIDYIVAVYLLIILAYLRRNGNYMIPGFLTVLVIGGVFVFLVYTGGYRGTALMWTYVYPLTVYFIFGTRAGTWIISVFFTAIMTIIVISNYGFLGVVYNSGTAFRYAGSFFSVTIIAYCFDYIRNRIQNELIEKNSQLEKNTENLERLNRILNRQATTDKLTNLPNRRKFNEVFLLEWNRAFRLCSEISLIICDLDYFKKFNDTYGHPEGDVCLKQVAGVLRRNMERPGDFASRIGGEEFALILVNTGKSGAETVAERIRDDIENLGIEHLKSLKYRKVTISLGISCCIPDRKKSRQMLLKTADNALYKSKSAGRNRVTFLQYDKSPAANDRQRS